MSTAIEKISARASKLYNGGKGTVKNWTKAREQASREYRQGKLGAVKIIQKGETKKSKVTKTLLQKRSPTGTFKGYKTVGSIEAQLGAVKNGSTFCYHKGVQIERKPIEVKKGKRMQKKHVFIVKGHVHPSLASAKKTIK